MNDPLTHYRILIFWKNITITCTQVSRLITDHFTFIFIAILISVRLTWSLADMTKKINAPDVLPFNAKRHRLAKSSALTPPKSTKLYKSPRGKMVSKFSGNKDHLAPTLEFMNDDFVVNVELIKSRALVDHLIAAAETSASVLSCLFSFCIRTFALPFPQFLLTHVLSCRC